MAVEAARVETAKLAGVHGVMDAIRKGEKNVVDFDTDSILALFKVGTTEFLEDDKAAPNADGIAKIKKTFAPARLRTATTSGSIREQAWQVDDNEVEQRVTSGKQTTGVKVILEDPLADPPADTHEDTLTL